MSELRKEAILNAVAGLGIDAALADLRLEIWLRFRDSSDEPKALIDAAVNVVGDGDPQAMLLANTPESAKLRMAFGDWLGIEDIPWPGLTPIRLRIAPWNGNMALSPTGLIQAIAAKSFVSEKVVASSGNTENVASVDTASIGVSDASK